MAEVFWGNWAGFVAGFLEGGAVQGNHKSYATTHRMHQVQRRESTIFP